MLLISLSVFFFSLLCGSITGTRIRVMHHTRHSVPWPTEYDCVTEIMKNNSILVLHLALGQSVRRTGAKLGDVRRCEASCAIIDDGTVDE